MPLHGGDSSSSGVLLTTSITLGHCELTILAVGGGGNYYNYLGGGGSGYIEWMTINLTELPDWNLLVTVARKGRQTSVCNNVLLEAQPGYGGNYVHRGTGFSGVGDHGPEQCETPGQGRSYGQDGEDCGDLWRPGKCCGYGEQCHKILQANVGLKKSCIRETTLSLKVGEK